MKSTSLPARVVGLASLCPFGAGAHVFAQPYSLPMPFAVYAMAATGALLLSFVIVGLFAVVPAVGQVPRSPRTGQATAARRQWPTELGRAHGVALLVLCIATGLAGNQNAFANFNMTFFWIGFVLVVPYAVALVGDFYAPVNPWRALTRLLASATGVSFEGRFAYPPRLAYAPGLVLYVAFIWLELFGQMQPRGLAIALGVYTALNLVGAYAVGTEAWFRHGEFFGIFLRLTGKMSPWARPWGVGDTQVAAPRWRLPFVGLLDEPAQDLSLVLFILFMVSSTAFDGLHSTLPWVSLYWKRIYPEIAPLLESLPGPRFRVSTQVYYLWQWFMLVLSPFVYLAVLAAFMAAAKAVTRSTLPLRTLVLRFAMPLVPIAFVYHLTHYYTLVFSQGGQLARLVSDPFGIGWNLFGTASDPVAPVMFDVGGIWITQLALILFGHVVGVYLAHVEALRVFGTPRRAAFSQLPMLVLMMVFTNAGLWILSLPIAGG